MKTFRMPMTTCPKCGYEMDAATNATGKGKPEIGDFTICLNCGQICRFAIGMALQVADLSDVNDKRAEHLLKRGQMFVRRRGLFRDPTINSKWGKR